MKTKEMVKWICIISCPCFLLSPLKAQKIVEKKINYRPGQEINLNLPMGENIKISGWEKNEIALTASVDINHNQLNEAYQLEVKEGDNISLSASLDENLLKNGKVKDCHCNYSIQSQYKDRNVKACIQIQYEIKVPRSAVLKLETISADVEVTGLENSSHIKSISGFIDFSWPAEKGAQLELKSITGELYTDFSFDILYLPDSPLKVANTLKGQTGKGGPTLNLETISSNIYLRKQ